MLLPHLSKDATLTGIDPETAWVEDATKRAQEKGLSSSAQYLLGSAETIPFPDNYFDMVTCQHDSPCSSKLTVSIEIFLALMHPIFVALLFYNQVQ